MPSTPTYGLPYPALTDPPDGPGQMQALAEQTEATIAATDSDVSSLGTRVSTLETETAFGAWQDMVLDSGLTARTGYYRPGFRLAPGDRIELIGAAIYTGGIVNGALVTTFPVGFRPAAETNTAIATNGGAAVNLHINPDGTATVVHLLDNNPTTVDFTGAWFHRVR